MKTLSDSIREDNWEPRKYVVAVGEACGNQPIYYKMINEIKKAFPNINLFKEVYEIPKKYYIEDLIEDGFTYNDLIEEIDLFLGKERPEYLPTLIEIKKTFGINESTNRIQNKRCNTKLNERYKFHFNKCF